MRLIDSVKQEPRWQGSDLSLEIRAAKCFVVTPNVQRMMWGLVQNPRWVDKGMALIALPFDETWIEWPGGILGLDIKLGIWCRAVDGDLRTFSMTVFGETNSFGRPLLVERVLAWDALAMASGRCGKYIRDLPQPLGPFVELADEDLNKVNAMAMAILLLMMAPRGISYDARCMAKVNKGRWAKGRPPLSDHTELRLDLSRVQRRRLGLAHGEARALREHEVKAHFKVRKTGVFLWMPFTRGDAALGRVTHDYRLTAH